MIELLEDYIRNNWHTFHLPFVLPVKLSYLFVKGFRKTIFLIFKDDDSQPFAALKVSNDPIAFDRLQKEYKTLSYLLKQGSLNGSIPIPLACFKMGSHQCLLESALAGTPMVYSMKGIRSKRELRKMEAFFKMVFDMLINLSHKREKVEAYHTQRTVVEHGDFKPSNIFVSKNGIKIFDWEYSKINGTPLHDLLDFSLMYVLFARYLMNEIAREEPVLNDFEEAFLSGKAHSAIIWEHIIAYNNKMDMSKSALQDIFLGFSRKYLSEQDARIFLKNLDSLLLSSSLFG